MRAFWRLRLEIENGNREAESWQRKKMRKTHTERGNECEKTKREEAISTCIQIAYVYSLWLSTEFFANELYFHSVNTHDAKRQFANVKFRRNNESINPK